MLLYLMRHGEAVASAVTDRDRQLTETGRTNNLATASALSERKPDISHALCSPYIRAQETAADLGSVIPGLDFQQVEFLTPDTPTNVFFDSVDNYCELQQVAALLLVGHNPLLSNALSVLMGGTQDRARHLDTSNLVCLNVEVLAPACAELKYWIRPEA